MELSEALSKVQLGEQIAMKVSRIGHEAMVFELLSHEGLVDQLVVADANQLGKEVAEKYWPQISDDPFEKFQILTDGFTEAAITRCLSWFSIGWMLGSPEYQAKQKTRESMVEELQQIPREEMHYLINRFMDEEQLTARLLSLIGESTSLVSQIFGDEGLMPSEYTSQRWCAMSAAPPMFSAFEMGTKARLMIEEDLVISRVAEEFE